MFWCRGGYIDLEEAKRRNIAVTNTPRVLDNAVADTAIALLLALLRQVVNADKFARSGKWEKEKFALGYDIAGKTCGIVGLGGIGKAIAKRAEAFGMNICYYGRHKKPEISYNYYDNLEAMAHDIDVMILAVPGGTETHHMVNKNILTALGTNGYLINIARGSVVNQNVLIDFLSNGKLAGAGLDVFEDEPHIPPALCKLENVVLLPHIASGTHETRAAMGELAVTNLSSYFLNKPGLLRIA